jgi:hypothetical protein
MSNATLKPFCATCLAETWDLVSEPVGRNGVPVRLCGVCRSAPVLAPGGAPSTTENARQQRARRAKLKKDGLCIVCGRIPAAAKTDSCNRCRKKTAARRVAAVAGGAV